MHPFSPISFGVCGPCKDLQTPFQRSKYDVAWKQAIINIASYRKPYNIPSDPSTLGVIGFVAFLIFGTRVAKTIGGDLMRIDLIEDRWKLWVLLVGLIGAILWDVITWYFGLPTSSSHALIGGYAGAAITAHHGVAGLLKPEAWIKTLGTLTGGWRSSIRWARS